MSKRLSDYGDNALLGSAVTLGGLITYAGIQWAGEKITAMWESDDESDVRQGPPRNSKKKKIKKKKKS
jgi:hypothetical protein